MRSTAALIAGHHASQSLGGLVWTAITAAVMFTLSYGKGRTGRELGNPVLETEGRVTFVDGLLAVAVLLGLLLDTTLGWWWAEPVAGYVIVYYAIREAIEIFRPEHGKQKPVIHKGAVVPNGRHSNRDSLLSAHSLYAECMGKSIFRWPWGRGRSEKDQAGAGPVRDIDVDTALVIEAARHVVTTRIATRTSLSRHLYIAPEIADQLLAKLEHCEVIAPARSGQAHRVIATSGELPGLIEEFRRRS